MQFDKTVVVAKYKEDISWINQLKDSCNIYVYNKNTDIDHDLYDLEPRYRIEDGITWCDLPNIGRESHTYLYHLVKNYENLSSTTIFLQGKPFDHCPFILKDIAELDKDISYKPFSRYANQTRKDFLDSLQDEEVRKINFYYGNHYSVYKELFNKELPEKYAVGIHGMFAVSREKILQNPKRIYESCLEKFNRKVYLTGFAMDAQGYSPQRLQTPEVIKKYDGMPNGEHFGWLFEYFWDLLFHSELKGHV